MIPRASVRESLLRADHVELRRRIVEGCPVDPASIEGFTYRGTSLGLPRVVEKLTWKSFQKTFWRDPDSGRLLGWNVRLHQDGVDAPSRPKTKRTGEPVTTGYYEVLTASEAHLSRAWPRGFDRGLIIDYARADNPVTDAMRLVKDPLVAVEDGNTDLLIGVSTVALPGVCIEIPTYFLLEREAPVSYVPAAARGARRARHILWGFERRTAELLFDALLGTGGDEGLPALATLDTTQFWRALDERTPPYFGPALRASVYALALAPLMMSGLRRPFPSLTRPERIACIERLGESKRYVVRQALATLKILACFAYFEDDQVSQRLGGGAP